jgi:hypothetical protein
MIRKVGKKLACGMLAVLLIVATGCTAVGGVDVKQAIINHFGVKSSESSMTMTLELTASAAATAEQKAALEAVKSISIHIPKISMQDAQNVSYEGEIKVSKGTIPFKVYDNGEQVIAEIEGAKKPIIFSTNGILTSNLSMSTNPMIDTMMGSILDNTDKVLPLLAGFVADNADNPATIGVESITEKVNNESLNLKKLHMELNGKDAGEYVSTILGNIASNEEGMKAFLSSLYDVVAPGIQASLEKSGGNSLLLGVIGNKELAVSFIYSFVKGELDKAAAKINTTIQENEGKGIFNEEAYVKSDIYVDNELNTRKAGFEALIPMSEDQDKGIGSIKLTAVSEKWNLNQPVTAAPIDTPEDAFVFEGKSFNPSKLVNNFDKQSTAFKVLKDDLMLTRKRINMVMDENAGQDPGESGKPFIKNGFTLVPVRFVVETLDADVAWDGDLRQVTIKDEWSGTTILLTIDSGIAIVNGKEEKLDVEALITGGSTYVPVRFIVENLGGKAGWDDATRTVSIARD